jgi:hypothetical protein
MSSFVVVLGMLKGREVDGRKAALSWMFVG